jgi:O-antigen/teichoic acid export membrane protein
VTPPAAGAAPPQARRAFSNAALNLVAGVLPFPLALVTVPAVIHGFGVERYGVLATAGVVLAYFALLDVGLGRAGTRFLARSLAAGDGGAAEMFWTVTALAAGVGVAGAVVLLGVAAPLVNDVLRVPADLAAESRSAFRALAAAVPLAIVVPTLLGALEAQRRFDLVAAIQVPAAALGLLAPLLVLPWTVHLAPAILAIAAVQALALAAALAACLATIPDARRAVRVRPGAVRELLGYGRWVAVSNVVGPLMVNADRLAIGAVLSVRWVTFYAAPYELVTRLSLVPSSLMRAMFPLFSGDRTPDLRDARALAVDGARAIALVLGPVAVLVVALAPDVLGLWLGAEFARLSAPSLELLAVGVTINALALVPFWLLQGLARPDVSAKFHLLEFVLYVPLLFVFLGSWGITGAAAAWTVRVTLDAVLLMWAAGRLVGFGEYRPRLAALAVYAALVVAALVLGHLLARTAGSGGARLLGAILLAGALAAAGWGVLLTGAERAAVTVSARSALRRETGP